MSTGDADAGDSDLDGEGRATGHSAAAAPSECAAGEIERAHVAMEERRGSRSEPARPPKHPLARHDETAAAEKKRARTGVAGAKKVARQREHEEGHTSRPGRVALAADGEGNAVRASPKGAESQADDIATKAAPARPSTAPERTDDGDLYDEDDVNGDGDDSDACDQRNNNKAPKGQTSSARVTEAPYGNKHSGHKHKAGSGNDSAAAELMPPPLETAATGRATQRTSRKPERKHHDDADAAAWPEREREPKSEQGVAVQPRGTSAYTTQCEPKRARTGDDKEQPASVPAPRPLQQRPVSILMDDDDDGTGSSSNRPDVKTAGLSGSIAGGSHTVAAESAPGEADTGRRCVRDVGANADGARAGGAKSPAVAQPSSESDRSAAREPTMQDLSLRPTKVLFHPASPFPSALPSLSSLSLSLVVLADNGVEREGVRGSLPWSCLLPLLLLDILHAPMPARFLSALCVRMLLPAWQGPPPAVAPAVIPSSPEPPPPPPPMPKSAQRVAGLRVGAGMAYASQQPPEPQASQTAAQPPPPPLQATPASNTPAVATPAGTVGRSASASSPPPPFTSPAGQAAGAALVGVGKTPQSPPPVPSSPLRLISPDAPPTGRAPSGGTGGRTTPAGSGSGGAGPFGEAVAGGELFGTGGTGVLLGHSQSQHSDLSQESVGQSLEYSLAGPHGDGDPRACERVLQISSRV